MPNDRNEVEYFLRTTSALELEYQDFKSHHKELSEFLEPNRGRFEITDRNNRGSGSRSGIRNRNSIINSKATWALGVATSGMFNGTMNPTQPWFKFGLLDPDLMEFQPVKTWLERQEKLIRAIFLDGNLYSAAPTLLKELLMFGTACMTQVDDFEHVSRFFNHTVGSFFIGQSERLVPNTIARKFQMTVIQLVRKFGLENVSSMARSSYDNSNYHSWIPVEQVIEPNEDVVPGSPLVTQMPFRSVYYEPGGGSFKENRFLKREGFLEFPGYCPRWETTGEDVYATNCPGMTALGDVIQIQTEELRKAQAIEKMTNPPLKGPPSFADVPVAALPGSLNIGKDALDADKLQSLYDVNLDIRWITADIKEVEERIKQAFHADMFLAISDSQGIQPRNMLDLSQRNEERLLQLGPVLQRVHGEFLARMVDRTFNRAVRLGLIHSAPPELEGKELDVRFISALAQAQRASATAQIDRVANFAAFLAQSKPEVMDKFDSDQSLDEYNDAVGGPPRIIIPDEIVQQTRAQRAQLEQAQAEAQIAQQAGAAASQVGNIDTSANKLAGQIARAS